MLSEHSEFFSEMTGIPLNIINSFWTLYLSLVSRRARIDPEKYAAKAKQFHDEWEKFVPWMPYSASIHRMLVHTVEMMRLLPETLTIAMMSEVSVAQWYFSMKLGKFCS